MHLLIFLGIIFGFIGWEILWCWIDMKIDFDGGPLLGIVVLITLGILAMIGWSIWNLTGLIH